MHNFLKFALRNIRRHKGYAALNILGLAVSFACVFLIVIRIQDEVSTDKFHDKGDRLYSVMRHSTFGGNLGTTQSMTKPLAAYMRDNYPEVEDAALLSWDSFALLSREGEAFRTNGRWAGRAFFEMFSFPLLKGDPATVLQSPESIVLSEASAVRFFGENWDMRDDILGSTVSIDNRLDLIVTGVFEDTPSNSSLDFEFIIPIEEFIARNEWVDQWDNNGLTLFATLVPGTNLAAFNEKISGVIDEHQDSYESEVFLFPFQDRHIYSNWENGVQSGGRILYIRLFSIIGVFLLLIASINFMNLSTARSAQRAREIGVRKTVGASRWTLASQFMGESIVKVSIAFVLSLLLLVAILPGFNALTESEATLASIQPLVWLQLFGIAMATGVLAGSYPALYLSGFSVTGVFDKRTTASGKGSGLRRALVVLQFSLSIILIVGTITIYRQLDYIMTKDLGLDRDNVAMVRLEGGVREQFDTFKQRALQIDGIESMTRSSNNPLQIGNDTIGVQWEGKDPDDNQLFWNSAVGYDFVHTMGIQMSTGRAFSRDFGSDSTNYLINWKAAEAMGMDDPVGQQISFWDVPGTIVGVMEDFHMSSMYRPITPVIFRLRPENTGIVFFRVAGDRTSDALAEFGELYSEFNPEFPLNVRFMDQEYDENYRSEQMIGSLAGIFAAIAIFIACLGLFGLASYTAEQRTREIGIRKVLGASVPSVVTLLSREFLFLVMIAFVVGAPVAWIVMNGWLDLFAFSIELGPGIIALTALVTVAIAGLTVSYQAFKSALSNPVEAIRSD